MLQTLEAQLARYRALITECFKQHPDHVLFTSLPGAGRETGSAIVGRTHRAQAAGRRAASLAVFGGYGSGELPIRQSIGGLSALPIATRFLRATIHRPILAAVPAARPFRKPDPININLNDLTKI